MIYKIKFLKKEKIITPKFLLALPVLILSLKFFLGSLFGYFTASFLAKRLKSLIFEIGRWKLHFHHWLYSVFTMIILLATDITIPHFVYGFLGGVIYEGIFSYSDWHRVLIRKK